LVIFAATAGMPTAVSMGKVMSVPPPASALTAPPAKAASPIRTNSNPPIISISLFYEFEIK
jgi:Tfp pilus assembly protein FimV